MKECGDIQLLHDPFGTDTGTAFTWWSQDVAEQRKQRKQRKDFNTIAHLLLITEVAANYASTYWRVSDTGTYRLEGQ